MSISYKTRPFNELSPLEVMQIFELRQAVFIVEQACLFNDIDQKDILSFHVLGFSQENELQAYARIVPPKFGFEEPSIGRICTKYSVRRTGLGKSLVQYAIEKTQHLFPKKNIRISAQSHLQAFYAYFGFKQISEPYEEDEILHVDMLLKLV